MVVQYTKQYRNIFVKLGICSLICFLVALLTSDVLMCIFFLGLASWSYLVQISLHRSFKLDERGLIWQNHFYPWSACAHLGHWGPMCGGRLRGSILHLKAGKLIEFNSLMSNYDEAVKLISAQVAGYSPQDSRFYYASAFWRHVCWALVGLHSALLWLSLCQACLTLFVAVLFIIILLLLWWEQMKYRLLVTPQIVALDKGNIDFLLFKDCLRADSYRQWRTAALQDLIPRRRLCIPWLNLQYYRLGQVFTFFTRRYPIGGFWNTWEDAQECVQRIEYFQKQGSSKPKHPERVAREALLDQHSQQVAAMLVLEASSESQLPADSPGADSLNSAQSLASDRHASISLKVDIGNKLLHLAHIAWYVIILVATISWAYDARSYLPAQWGHIAWVNILVGWLLAPILIVSACGSMLRLSWHNNIWMTWEFNAQGVYSHHQIDPVLTWDQVAMWSLVESKSPSAYQTKLQVVLWNQQGKALLVFDNTYRNFTTAFLFVRHQVGPPNEDAAPYYYHIKRPKIMPAMGAILMLWILYSGIYQALFLGQTMRDHTCQTTAVVNTKHIWYLRGHAFCLAHYHVAQQEWLTVVHYRGSRASAPRAAKIYQLPLYYHRQDARWHLLPPQEKFTNVWQPLLPTSKEQPELHKLLDDLVRDGDAWLARIFLLLVAYNGLLLLWRVARGSYSQKRLKTMIKQTAGSSQDPAPPTQAAPSL